MKTIKIFAAASIFLQASAFAETIVISDLSDYGRYVSGYAFNFSSSGDILQVDIDLTGSCAIEYINGASSAGYSDAFTIETSKDSAVIGSSGNSLFRWGAEGKGVFTIGERVEAVSYQHVLRSNVGVKVRGEMTCAQNLSMDQNSLLTAEGGGRVSVGETLNAWGDGARVVVESGGSVVANGWAELGGDSSSFTVRGYFQSARLNLSGTGAMFDVEAGGNAAIMGDVLINNGGMILVGGSMDVNGTVASDSSMTIEFTDSSALLDVAEFDLEEVNLNGLWGEGNLIISSMTEDAIRAIRWFHDGEELICGRTYFLADNPGGGYVFSSVPEPAEIAAIMAAFVLISAVWRRMGK